MILQPQIWVKEKEKFYESSKSNCYIMLSYSLFQHITDECFNAVITF